MHPKTMKPATLFAVLCVSVLQSAACVVNNESYSPGPPPGAMNPPTRYGVSNGGPVTLDPSGSSGGSGGSDDPSNSRQDAGVMILSCASGALFGGRIPVGTKATASSSYGNDTPAEAIDDELASGWNAGLNKGWLKLVFPAPVTFKAVHIAAFASPEADETFTISAEGTKVIGSGNRHVSAKFGSSPTILDPIQAGPGTHSSITISVEGGASWVMIAEVTLVTELCQR